MNSKNDRQVGNNSRHNRYEIKHRETTKSSTKLINKQEVAEFTEFISLGSNVTTECDIEAESVPKLTKANQTFPMIHGITISEQII
ncbi:hypothetical protein CHS0354_013750, partial [Potamilus streckersoni]